MGIFWKRVDELPPQEGSVILAGDPRAISKRWPFLWRLQNDWIPLLVREPRNYADGSYIYFRSGTCSMRCRRLLTTRHVLVRIGPEPVTFWVKSKAGHLGMLQQIPGRLPGCLSRKKINVSDAQSLTVQAMNGGHTYI